MIASLRKMLATRGALLLAGGLVLLASVVSGRQEPSAQVVEAATPRKAAEDIEIRTSGRKEEKAQPVDLFATSISNSKEILPETAPPAPSAPPLPFQVLGRAVDTEKSSVFLTRGEEHYAVQAGQKIGTEYKVLRITESRITFVYLPLGTRQSLPLLDLN